MANILSLPNELLFQIVECLQRQSIRIPWKPHSNFYYLSYGSKAVCLVSVAHSCRRLRDAAFPLLHRRLELSHSTSCQVGTFISASCKVVFPAYVPLITYLYKHPDRGYATRELKIGPWSPASHWDQLRLYMSEDDLQHQIQTFKAVAERCGVAYPVLLDGIDAGDAGVFVTLLTYLLPSLKELILTTGDKASAGIPSTRHMIVAWKTVRPACFQTLTSVNINYGDVVSHGEYPCASTITQFLQLPNLRKFTVQTQQPDPYNVTMDHRTTWRQLAAELPDIFMSPTSPQKPAFSAHTSWPSGISGGDTTAAERSSQFDEELRLSYRDCSGEDLLALCPQSASALERMELSGTWMGQWNILPILRTAAHLKALKLTDNSFNARWPDIVDAAISSHAPSLEILILDIGSMSFTPNTQEPSFLPCIAAAPHLKILWLNYRSILTSLRQPLDLQKFLPQSLHNLVIKDTMMALSSWDRYRLKQLDFFNAIQSLSSITREGLPNLEVVHVWKPRLEHWCYKDMQQKLEGLQELFAMQEIELLLM
ncbi:hypothetical protein TWF696_001500 [Orbilia brochopaga]|uniref:F-box domain-containing protein n=1 Tax=Orbilia brochopaga TaxID=3140254 RepID=A0AAV9UB80_9PEZI